MTWKNEKQRHCMASRGVRSAIEVNKKLEALKSTYEIQKTQIETDARRNIIKDIESKIPVVIDGVTFHDKTIEVVVTLDNPISVEWLKYNKWIGENYSTFINYKRPTSKTGICPYWPESFLPTPYLPKNSDKWKIGEVKTIHKLRVVGTDTNHLISQLHNTIKSLRQIEEN